MSGGDKGTAQRTFGIPGDRKPGTPGAPREGVRPVALQPLQSAGRGGRGGFEDGYAEMARSLMAMNQGPAKQGIFAAQLKDVDGTPLGGGAFGGLGGPGGLTGSKGGLNNKSSYKNQLPWWWDFEKQKLMDKWKLWNYNWQEMFSKNLIKMTSGLMCCLFTGSEDCSMKNFIGTPADNSGGICAYADGTPVKGVQSVGDWAKAFQYTSGESTDKGTNKTTQSSLGAGVKGDYIEDVCKPAGGTRIVTDLGTYHGFFMTRARCLGFRKQPKSTQGLTEKDNCTMVIYNDGAYSFTAVVGNDRSKKRDTRKDANAKANLVHYVIAKDMNQVEVKGGDKANITNTRRQERMRRSGRATEEDFKQGSPGPTGTVIYIVKGATLCSDCLNAKIEKLNADFSRDYVITNIVGFVSNKHEMTHDSYTSTKDLDGTNIKSWIEPLMKTIEGGGSVSEADVAKALGKNALPGASLRVQCQIKDTFRGKRFINKQHESPLIRCDRDISPENIHISPDITSDDYKESAKDMKAGKRTFSAELMGITDSTCVYAVLAESSPAFDGGSEESNLPVKPLTVKQVVNFQMQGQNAGKAKIADGHYKFYFTWPIAIDQNPAGYGEVYWLADATCEGVTTTPGTQLKGTSDGGRIKELLGSFTAGEQLYGLCPYQWNCLEGICGPKKSKDDNNNNNGGPGTPGNRPGFDCGTKKITLGNLNQSSGKNGQMFCYSGSDSNREYYPAASLTGGASTFWFKQKGVTTPTLETKACVLANYATDEADCVGIKLYAFRIDTRKCQEVCVDRHMPYNTLVLVEDGKRVGVFFERDSFPNEYYKNDNTCKCEQFIQGEYCYDKTKHEFVIIGPNGEQGDAAARWLKKEGMFWGGGKMYDTLRCVAEKYAQGQNPLVGFDGNDDGLLKWLSGNRGEKEPIVCPCSKTPPPVKYYCTEDSKKWESDSAGNITGPELTDTTGYTSAGQCKGNKRIVVSENKPNRSFYEWAKMNSTWYFVKHKSGDRENKLDIPDSDTGPFDIQQANGLCFCESNKRYYRTSKPSDTNPLAESWTEAQLHAEDVFIPNPPPECSKCPKPDDMPCDLECNDGVLATKLSKKITESSCVDCRDYVLNIPYIKEIGKDSATFNDYLAHVCSLSGDIPAAEVCHFYCAIAPGAGTNIPLSFLGYISPEAATKAAEATLTFVNGDPNDSSVFPLRGITKPPPYQWCHNCDEAQGAVSKADFKRYLELICRDGFGKNSNIISGGSVGPKGKVCSLLPSDKVECVEGTT